MALRLPAIIALKSPEEGMFYALLSVREGLTVNQLKKKIKATEFERTITSSKRKRDLKKQFLMSETIVKEIGKNETFTIENINIGFANNDILICIRSLFQDKELVEFLNSHQPLSDN